MLLGDVVVKLDGVDIYGVDDLICVFDCDCIGWCFVMDVLWFGWLCMIDVDLIECKLV